MELRQLEYPAAVAGEANFTRAAQRAGISRPGVSARVRRLGRPPAGTLVQPASRAAVTARVE